MIMTVVPFGRLFSRFLRWRGQVGKEVDETCEFLSSAHNPEAAGSSPVSATSNKKRASQRRCSLFVTVSYRRKDLNARYRANIRGMFVTERTGARRGRRIKSCLRNQNAKAHPRGCAFCILIRWQNGICVSGYARRA